MKYLNDQSVQALTKAAQKLLEDCEEAYKSLIECERYDFVEVACSPESALTRERDRASRRQRKKAQLSEWF